MDSAPSTKPYQIISYKIGKLHVSINDKAGRGSSQKLITDKNKLNLNKSEHLPITSISNIQIYILLFTQGTVNVVRKCNPSR